MSDVLLSGCAIMRDRRLLLIRKKGKEFWELPGGIVQDRQDDEKAAVDRTASQIGATPTVVQLFTVLEYQVGGKNLEAMIFECDLDEDVSFSPGENIDAVDWFDISTLGDEAVGEDVRAILEEL